MIIGSLTDHAGGRILLARVRKTTCWTDRLRGLLRQPEPGPDEGLLITPCNSVHMLFMRYPLDIVFLDKRGTVIGMRTPLAPWKSAGKFGAYSVLEIKAGMVNRLNIQCGTTLLWQ